MNKKRRVSTAGQKRRMDDKYKQRLWPEDYGFLDDGEFYPGGGFSDSETEESEKEEEEAISDCEIGNFELEVKLEESEKEEEEAISDCETGNFELDRVKLDDADVVKLEESEKEEAISDLKEENMYVDTDSDSEGEQLWKKTRKSWEKTEEEEEEEEEEDDDEEDDEEEEEEEEDWEKMDWREILEWRREKAKKLYAIRMKPWLEAMERSRAQRIKLEEEEGRAERMDEWRAKKMKLKKEKKNIVEAIFRQGLGL